MRRNKLLLLINNDYIGIAGSVTSGITDVIFVIDSTKRQNSGAITIQSARNIFQQSTSSLDVNSDSVKNRLDQKFDDEDYYTAGL